jgi:hypothetical protein
MDQSLIANGYFRNLYWVQPGVLLAGQYPGSPYNEDETRRKLNLLLDLGVRHFIDLTAPGAAVPYDPVLRELSGWLNLETDYQRCAIADYSVPPVETMVKILDAVDAAVQRGGAAYVHCWGGLGRTGMVVGCHLARHGLSGKQALKRIAQLRTGLANNSPETDAQCALVLGWQTGQ